MFEGECHFFWPLLKITFSSPIIGDSKAKEATKATAYESPICPKNS